MSGAKANAPRFRQGDRVTVTGGPYCAGMTGIVACIHEHMRCITIEREADYLPLIVARLSKPMAVGFDFEEPA